MRIVIASDIYFPMINGVAVFAHNLALGLAKKGHEVMVICPSFTGKKHRTTKDGVTTVYLKSVRFPFYPDQINKVPENKKLFGLKMPKIIYKNGIWNAPYPYPEVKKALKKFKPDVIHNQTAEAIAIAVTIYAHKYNVPLVATGHAYPDNITGQFKSLKPIKKPLDAILRSYMASFLKRSEYATMPTEMAINDLVPKDRKRFGVTVEALSNGVDLTAFAPGIADDKIYEKYGIPKNRPTVLYVGRVDPEKSISNVVKAFTKVLKTIPEALMVVAGDGTDKQHLEELVQEFGISGSVMFLGKVMPPELMEIYKTGTLFATASETETQGIVLIEAAATGLPIVAVDKGAVREICRDKENGKLCKPGGDINGLSKGMIEILSDDKLRKKYSERSLELSKKHDLNNTIARFEEIYSDVTKKKIEE